MAQYITRPSGHDTTYVGPYTTTSASVRAYLLQGKFKALAATVDRYLGPVTPPGMKFVPLGSRFFAVFGAMGNVVSSDPTLGSMREIDCSCLIPVLRLDGHIPTGIALFGPYLFVDIPQAMATGREVHGYRKELGTSFSDKDTFADAWKPDAADLTHIEGWAVAKNGDRLKRQRLVDVTAPPPGGAPIAWNDPVQALVEILAAVVEGLDDLVAAVATVLNDAGKLPSKLLSTALETLVKAMVADKKITGTAAFLRQFRHPQHTEQADVRQLVLAKTRVDLASVSVQKLPPGYAVTFHDMASHPFSTELGVKDATAVPSALTVEATCTFTLEEADEVH
jgi:hypothetical protein